MIGFCCGWFYLNRGQLVFFRLMRDDGHPIDAMRFLRDALSAGPIHLKKDR
jgi:hypothetical protein